MTGELRTTLQRRADAVGPWTCDLEAVVRAGDRRVRRRRTALAVGLAGILVIAGGLTTLAVRSHSTTPQPAGPDAIPLSYAVGSVIHTGADTVDVGRQVMSLARTTDGFVFTTPDLQVFAEKDGDLRPIGHLATANTRLVAADDGHYVGWWDGEQFQLWPGVNGHTDSVDVGSRGSGLPPGVLSISAAHVWMWNGARIWVTDKPTSDAVYPTFAGADAATVQDAAAGKLLVRVDGGMAVVEEPGPEAPSGLPQVQPQVPGATTGDLAPDGRHWFTADGSSQDRFEVFDSATGRRQTPSFDGGHVTPYAWLGDDTIAAWTLPDGVPGSPVSLLTCQVSTDTCTVAASRVGPFGSIALSGVPIGG